MPDCNITVHPTGNIGDNAGIEIKDEINFELIELEELSRRDFASQKRPPYDRYKGW